MSKLITVFGATGLQGGSVIKAILSDAILSRQFKIRGITRDTSKPAAQELSKQGVELVNADMNSRSSVDAAVKDAHTVFLVTNFWETMSRDTEVKQGKIVTDSAKAAGVQHLIFSSLNNITETSGGKLTHVLHFDGKADIEQYMRQSGVPSTFVLPGYYMSNFLQFMPKGEDGSYTLAVPISATKSRFPLIDIADDYGSFVKPALLHGPKSDKIKDNRILAAAAYYSGQEIMDTFMKTTGKGAKFQSIPEEVYKTFLPPAMQMELLENHLALEDPGYYAGAALEPSVKLVEEAGGKVTTWEAFIKKQSVWME